MKPFDIEKALAGAKVVTGDGRSVTGIREIHNFPRTYRDVGDLAPDQEYHEAQGIRGTIHNPNFADEYSFYHNGVSNCYCCGGKGTNSNANLYMK